MSFSHPGRCLTKPPTPAWPAPSLPRHPAAEPCATGLTAAATTSSTGHCPASPKTRMIHCPRTRDYVPPPQLGKTDREIRRCLRRYIARELYRTPSTPAQPLTTHRSVERVHLSADGRDCPARHCWSYPDPADRSGHKQLDLLVEWRRASTGPGWQGLVVYAAQLRPGRWAVVEE